MSYRVCSPFHGVSASDLKNFFNSIADDFADLVQYNEDNRLNVDEKYKNVTINTVSTFYEWMLVHFHKTSCVQVKTNERNLRYFTMTYIQGMFTITIT